MEYFIKNGLKIEKFESIEFIPEYEFYFHKKDENGEEYIKHREGEFVKKQIEDGINYYYDFGFNVKLNKENLVDVFYTYLEKMGEQKGNQFLNPKTVFIVELTINNKKIAKYYSDCVDDILKYVFDELKNKDYLDFDKLRINFLHNEV